MQCIKMTTKSGTLLIILGHYNFVVYVRNLQAVVKKMPYGLKMEGLCARIAIIKKMNFKQE
ncbi:MAG TPA: hypothetical protein ENI07_08715 [Desulfobacterales bacterium]|nr:hypothetical protein [Desulfobacterales bacterium]